MEVTALCIKIIRYALMLLIRKDQPCYCANELGAVFLHIVPNSLQFFEFDSISYDCIGFGDFNEWRVMRKVLGVETICSPNWETSVGPCFIRNAYGADSGEYWCEAHGEARSNPVNITVTAGSVILRSPAVPVIRGEDVTLSCINKDTFSLYPADFFKNGVFLEETGYRGNLTIHNVSKTDEGLYKCHIIGVGESPESWLAVREPHVETHHHWFPVFFKWIMCTVAVLLPVVGLGLCWKCRAQICSSSEPLSVSRSPSSAERQTESGEPTFAETHAGDRCATTEYAFYYTID